MDQRIKQAEAAFILGFPLVFNLDQMQRFTTEGLGNLPAAPFNKFSHGKNKATPEDRFVSVNNDTVYSTSQVDLSAGPLVLEIPPIKQRYYVFQLVDAWTENFAYLGQRSLGETGGTFLLVPPGWSKPLPDVGERINCPTKLLTIVGRWACANDEVGIIEALQEQVRLYPLEEHPQAYRWPVITRPALAFWEKFWYYLKDFPLSPAFASYQPLLDELGLTEGPAFQPSEMLQQILILGAKIGSKAIDTCLMSGNAEMEHGWQKNYHIFDYNVEFFERGTEKQSQWLMDHRNQADLTKLFLTRAAAAKGGLWGNHGYEAIYLPIYLDDQGNQLTGSKNYRLTFQQTPPTNAFWSLTMYSLPDYYLVENELQRYSIGDRTPDLIFNQGELTIYLSANRPHQLEMQKNWLPTPLGDYRPLLRVYLPKESLFDGSYIFPEIRVSEELF